MTQQIVLVVGDEKLSIDEAELRGWVSFHEERDGGYDPTMDTAPLTGIVEALAKKIDREPVNADVRHDQRPGHRNHPEQGRLQGRRRRPRSPRSRNCWPHARLATETTEIVPVMAVTPPALTTAQAEAAAPLMVKISEWKTYFPISEKNGFGANIWIPALEIDGYVVGPHETFDFWDAIGPVTRERGYRDGGAIINGRTEPQGALAGGICSCSTTLFNAALRAGFEMGARRNHYYYIDRYPLGLDATVFISASGSVQTMSWTNDTDYPVLIRGYKIKEGNRGYVKFELYSVPERAQCRDRRADRQERPAGERLDPADHHAGRRRAQADRVPGRRQAGLADRDRLQRRRHHPAPEDLLLELRADHRDRAGRPGHRRPPPAPEPTPDPTPEATPEPTPEPTPAAP